MMRYRTYEAETLQQAILKMTIDLGKDALLVSHCSIKRGGFMGLGSKRIVEVTGALPIQKANDSGPITKEIKPKSFEKRFNPSACSPSIEELAMASIKKELEEIKTRMDVVLNEHKTSPTNSYPGRCGELYLRLIRQEVEEDLAERLLETLTRKVREGYDDIILLERHLTQLITDLIKVDRLIQVEENSPRIIALIGPTGVGKTTTLSKLAADFTCNRGMEVVLVTIDTYRIAAVDQLKTYAEILDIPLEVVFTPEEFKNAISDHPEADLILVDTAGRSQRDRQQMDELKNFVDHSDYRLESILVLSTTTKYKDMLDIVDKFKKIPFDKVILTKLDETVTFGPMLNILNKISQKLSYVTMGQNVPEDIEAADPNKIARMILER